MLHHIVLIMIHCMLLCGTDMPKRWHAESQHQASIGVGHVTAAERTAAEVCTRAQAKYVSQLRNGRVAAVACCRSGSVRLLKMIPVRLVLCRASLAAGDFEGTVAGRVLEAADMPPAAAPNCLLAVLWASLANTVSCIIQVPLLGVRLPVSHAVGQLG